MAQLPPYILIDDDDDDLFIMRRLLTKAGVENKGISFQEPRVALGYLEAQIQADVELLIPFLIFTDLNMPHVDGFEVIKWIRSQPRLKKSTLAVLSSSADPADRERSLALGADLFFTKYPNVVEIYQLVKAAGGKVVDGPAGLTME